VNELTHEGLLFYALLAFGFLSVYGVIEWLLERRDNRRGKRNERI